MTNTPSPCKRPLAVTLAAAFVALWSFANTSIAASGKPKAGDPLAFTDVRKQSEQFIDYWNAIPLPPAQEKIKAEALTSIKAPCCSEYSMQTCCCPCNLAKSAWGLSHYLIAKQGYTAPQVKAAVERWLGFVNPKGFTGNACFTGGCNRPFAKNGCGGMEATRVILGDDVQ